MILNSGKCTLPFKLNYMFNVQVSKQVIVDTSSETHGPSEKRDRLWVSDDVESNSRFH